MRLFYLGWEFRRHRLRNGPGQHQGMGNRTLSLTNLGKIRVPAPPIELQQPFDVMQVKVSRLKAKQVAIREANQALLPAILERVFANAD